MWLVTKGRDAEAKKAWRRLVRRPCPDFDHEHEFNIFRDEIHLSEAVTRLSSENDWKALFKWINFKRAIAVALPFAAQQLCGVPYISNYTTYFFQIAGLNNPFLGNLILTLVSFTCVVISLFSIDRIGRRRPVLFALVALGFLNIIIGSLSWIKASNAAGGGSLVAMCALWQAVFSLTINPIGESKGPCNRLTLCRVGRNRGSIFGPPSSQVGSIWGDGQCPLESDLCEQKCR